MAWMYAGFLLILVAVLYSLGDRWWPAILILFGPRWIWGTPLVALTPVILWWKPRSIGVIILSAYLFLGPLSGLCIPISWRTIGEKPRVQRFRVLTCNVHYADLDADRLGELISATAPDFVALQEWSPAYSLSKVFSEPGWYIHTGQYTCAASRYPIREMQVFPLSEQGVEREGTACRYLIKTPTDNIQCFNLYLISPSVSLSGVQRRPERLGDGLRENISVRRRESELASRWAESFTGPRLLAGDFNLPVESAIYRRYWSPYTNAFSVAGWGFGYSRLTPWHGVRIDHVLAGPGWQVERAARWDQTSGPTTDR